MGGTAATFAAGTDSGMEARLQFRTGVAATLNITADAITITSVSDGSGSGRRLQSGGVTVDYTATAEDDVAGTLDDSDFTSELVDNINDAGDSLDLSSSDVSSGSATVETEIVFEVATEVTGEEAGDPAASVTDMLDDPSSLESQINAGGGTVS